MSTKNPRVNVVLERRLYSTLKEMSKKEGTSMSTLARDLIKKSLELREDIALSDIAEKREKTLKKSEILTHEDIWG